MSESSQSHVESNLVTSEDLLEAANDASAQARNMWLFFLGLMAYLIVTIAGTTHKNLLLNNPVKLPFLNVDIPLFSFFIYAPGIVLAMHLGLLIQHAMLAFKLFRFTETLNDDGWHRQGSDPRRGKLHPYIVSQLIAGPERGALIGFLIRLMTWISLVALPVAVLIYFQIAFLPYHDEGATYWHRIAVLLDCLILFALWPYMRPATKREAKAKLKRTELTDRGWPWRVTAVGFGVGGVGMIVLLLFSWFVATIPDACLYKGRFNVLCLDKMMASFTPWTVKIKSGNTERKVFWLTAALFEGAPDPVTGRPKSVWSRNIVLTDADLVPEKKFNEGEVSLSLRGRDLRYAVLDRSDLHRVDFTGVDLRGASLKETRLEEAKFCLPLKVFPRTCSEFTGADLKEANLQGIDFWGANLKGAQLAFVRLEGADFRNAQLEGADLSFAELKEANLSLANLQGAKLSYAKLQNANLGEAELQEADLLNANLQGANFGNAQMEGANLKTANLQAAEMTSARLRGADLTQAKLEGASLRRADLRGSKLDAASLKGTDLRSVRLWGASHPGKGNKLDLADLKDVSFKEMTIAEQEELKAIIEGLGEEKHRKRLIQKMEKAGLLKKGSEAVWAGRQDWQSSFERFKERDPNADHEQFNTFWSKLACQNVEISASVAARINKKGYFINPESIARSLTSRSCEAAPKLNEVARAELCRVASWPVDARKETVCR